MHLSFSSNSLLFLSWLTSSVIAGPLSRRDDAQAQWPRDAEKCKKNDVYTKGVGFSHDDLYEKDGLCVTRWDEGVLPRRIYAEAKEDGLRRIEIEWTDDEKKVSFGTSGKKKFSGVLEWSPLVDKWEYLGFNQDGWRGGIGRMVGKLKRRIEGTTTTLDAGGDHKNKLMFQPDIGEGMLIGFKIRAGDLVDYIEPMFTQTSVRSMALRNMKFTPSWEDLNKLPFSDRQMQVLDIGHTYTNRVNASAQLIIDASFNVRRSTDVQFSETTMREKHGNVDLDWFNTEVEGKIGIPFTDIAWDLKWKPDLIKGGYKQMDMKNKLNSVRNTTSEATTARARAYQSVPPLSSVTCVTAIIQSDVTLDFTGDMFWIFEDGKEHKYPVQGRFQNANFANAVTDCWPMPADEFEKLSGYKPSTGLWDPPTMVGNDDGQNAVRMDDDADVDEDDGDADHNTVVNARRKRSLPSFLAADNSRVVYGAADGEEGPFEGRPEVSMTVEDMEGNPVEEP